MTILEQAEALATKAHEWQIRRNGEPYINHPRRIVESLKNLGVTHEPILAAARLHDVVEDRGYIDEVEDICPIVSYYVSYLTKLEEQTYEEYIIAMVEAEQHYRLEWLKLIKLCDIRDNIWEWSTEKQREKYLKALSILIS